MKTTTLLTAAALGLGLAATANAQNRVHLTGATAFRSAFYDAMMTNLVFDAVPNMAAFKCSTPTGGNPVDPHTANYHVFDGLIGGAQYIVKCSWSGSEAGITDANTGATKSFLQDPVAGAVVGGDGFVQIGEITTATPLASELVSASVDLCTADNSLLISKTPTASLTGSEIGIVPFMWVKNAQAGLNTAQQAAYDRLVNVTHPQVRVALTAPAPSGTCLALFTGNTADDTAAAGGNGLKVYVTGRDNNSGTRANCLADCGFGVKKTVFQTNLGGSSGAPTAVAFAPNAGESSGGTLISEMGFTGSGPLGWFAIGYIGLADYIETGAAAGVVPLTLNGMSCTADNVRHGAYSYWGKEHIFDRPSNPNAAAHTFFAKVTTPIVGDPENDTPLQQVAVEPKVIKLTAMRALKSTDLADPTHKP